MTTFKEETVNLIPNNFKACRLCGVIYTRHGLIRHFGMKHKEELEAFLVKGEEK